MNDDSRKVYRVLSIDGGGIRGIIPAMVLQEIAKRLAAAGKSTAFHEAFDLVVGTSTGAIIAAGLAMPHPTDPTRIAATPTELVALYDDNGSQIFPQARTVIGKLLRRLYSLFRGASYSSQVLEDLLRSYFGEKTTVDKARTELVLTTYDIEGCAARFFRRSDSATDPLVPLLPVWKLVRASSAGPTYFPPMPIQLKPDAEGKEHWTTCVDGGVFANDPGLVAYVEAQKLAIKQGESNPCIQVISLGTGTKLKSHTYREARNWGLIRWLWKKDERPLIDAFMQGQASTSSYQLNKILNPDGVDISSSKTFVDGVMKPNAVRPSDLRYIRIDGPLDKDTEPQLDRASPENIARLMADADRIININTVLIDEIVQRL